MRELAAVKQEKFAKKKKKYSEGKVVTFTVLRLIFFQHPVDLLTFFKLYFENEGIWTCWRHLSRQFCPGGKARVFGDLPLPFASFKR